MPRLAPGSTWTLFLTVVLAAPAQDSLTARRDEYQLSPRDGPYLILVASFVGDEAETLAKNLVQELRRDYKLQAYWFSKSEQERAERDRLLEQWKRQHNNAPVRKYRIVDEYCVLVGHYKSLEAASKDLDRIKKLKPPSSVPPGPGLFIARPEYRQNVPNWLEGGRIQQGGLVNQFSRAFVVRNPLLPSEKPPVPTSADLAEEDAALISLNANEKYGLSKSTGKYTLLVSIHSGASVTTSPKPSVFDRINPWSNESGLFRTRPERETSAVQEARQLAQLLRDSRFGYTAYVLHSKAASFVTIGDFEGPDDPELARVQKQVAGLKVGPYQLLAQPVPLPIPRQ